MLSCECILFFIAFFLLGARCVTAVGSGAAAHGQGVAGVTFHVHVALPLCFLEIVMSGYLMVGDVSPYSTTAGVLVCVYYCMITSFWAGQVASINKIDVLPGWAGGHGRLTLLPHSRQR